MGFRFENMMLYGYSHSGVKESEQVALGYVAIFNSAVGYSVSVAGHSSGQPEVMQQTTYYPFGYTLEQSNYYSLWSEMNKNLYNGKELQDDELGGVRLDWYDYGARMYDPALGRFHVQDRLAENYYGLSPYQYTANNPIRFIDVNGDYIYISDKAGNHYKYDQGQLYSRNDDGDWVEYTTEEGSFVHGVYSALNELVGGGDAGESLVNFFGNEENNAIC